MMYLMQISLRISLIQEYPGYFVKKSRYSENLQPNRTGAIQDIKCSIRNLYPGLGTGLDSAPALSYMRGALLNTDRSLPVVWGSVE